MPREHHYDTKVLFRTEKHPVTTTATWAVTDRAGYGSVEFIVSKSLCTATTARVIVELQSGTATSAHTLATTNEMIGKQSVTLNGTQAVGCRLGYIGSDRYVSVRVNPTNTNVTGALSCVVLLGDPIKQPQTGGGTTTTGFTTTFPQTVGAPAL